VTDEEDPKIAAAVALYSTHVAIGPKGSCDRLVTEYAWSDADLDGKVIVKAPDWVAADGRQSTDPPTYYVHRSLLRPHPPFSCAGDEEAAEFCREIGTAMHLNFAITWDEAVARINRHWWTPNEAGGSVPRTWIAGLDIVFHEDADYWTKTIYYGKESFWWLPGAHPQPLPPP
jgi:hypothetical protein